MWLCLFFEAVTPQRSCSMHYRVKDRLRFRAWRSQRRLSKLTLLRQQVCVMRKCRSLIHRCVSKHHHAPSARICHHLSFQGLCFLCLFGLMHSNAIYTHISFDFHTQMDAGKKSNSQDWLECSILKTGKNPTTGYYRVCYTCTQDLNVYDLQHQEMQICLICSEVCHKGHQLSSR